jgi:4-nitrophenyl phosphatase
MSTNNNLDLAAVRAVALDLDGVVWRGSEILPGVPDFFLFLRDRHIPYLAMTNNSSRTVAEYVKRLEDIGIPVDGEHVITSSAVTADYLARHYPPGTPLYVIGSDSLKALLTARGNVIDPDEARVVVVGLDVTLTYDKLAVAGQRIMAGADFIGTNADATFPTAGKIAPGNGSQLAALITMTGRKPVVLGKPEPAMFMAALERLGTAPADTLMIGDRLDTDIAGAVQVGIRTALVLSGVPAAQGATVATPDAVYEDLADLLAAWPR